MWAQDIFASRMIAPTLEALEGISRIRAAVTQERRKLGSIVGGKRGAGRDRCCGSVASADTAILKDFSENSDTRAGNGHLSAWMRSAGTSPSVTQGNENKSFTRHFAGCSEVCFTV